MEGFRLSEEMLKDQSLIVEVREILEAITWRKVREQCGREMHTKPKVGDVQEDCEVGRVIGVCESVEKDGQEDDGETDRRHSRMFEIETGRWRSMTGEERRAKICDHGQVDIVEHWLMR